MRFWTVPSNVTAAPSWHDALAAAMTEFFFANGRDTIGQILCGQGRPHLAQSARESVKINRRARESLHAPPVTGKSISNTFLRVVVRVGYSLTLRRRSGERMS